MKIFHSLAALTIFALVSCDSVFATVPKDSKMGAQGAEAPEVISVPLTVSFDDLVAPPKSNSSETVDGNTKDKMQAKTASVNLPSPGRLPEVVKATPTPKPTQDDGGRGKPPPAPAPSITVPKLFPIPGQMPQVVKVTPTPKPTKDDNGGKKSTPAPAPSNDGPQISPSVGLSPEVIKVLPTPEQEN